MANNDKGKIRFALRRLGDDEAAREGETVRTAGEIKARFAADASRDITRLEALVASREEELRDLEARTAELERAKPDAEAALRANRAEAEVERLAGLLDDRAVEIDQLRRLLQETGPEGEAEAVEEIKAAQRTVEEACRAVEAVRIKTPAVQIQLSMLRRALQTLADIIAYHPVFDEEEEDGDGLRVVTGGRS